MWFLTIFKLKCDVISAIITSTYISVDHYIWLWINTIDMNSVNETNEPKNNFSFEPWTTNHSAVHVDSKHVLQRKTRLYCANPPWRVSMEFFWSPWNNTHPERHGSTCIAAWTTTLPSTSMKRTHWELPQTCCCFLQYSTFSVCLTLKQE